MSWLTSKHATSNTSRGPRAGPPPPPAPAALTNHPAASPVARTAGNSRHEPNRFRLHGACHCGAVTFSVPVAHDQPWLRCHCQYCRRAHAAAWATLIPPEDGASSITWSGKLQTGPASKCSGLGSVPGSVVRRDFCSTCGSTLAVTLEVGGQARCRLVTAGALDDQTFPLNFQPKIKELCTGMQAQFLCSKPPGDTADKGTRGSCSCGCCRFETSKLPEEVHHCHCSTCRRASGTAFISWSPLEKRAVTWLRHGKLGRVRASKWATRSVCLLCGTSMAMTYDGQESTIWLAAGTFTESAFPGPLKALHICAASAPPWRRPETWPLDGLKRVPGTFDGDYDGQEQAELDVAVRLSMQEAEGAHQANEERDLDEALQRSWEEASVKSNPVQHKGEASVLAMLMELSGCSEAVARATLAEAAGDADRAAGILLEQVEAPAAQPSAPSSPPRASSTSSAAFVTTPSPSVAAEKAATPSPLSHPGCGSRRWGQRAWGRKRLKSTVGAIELSGSEGEEVPVKPPGRQEESRWLQEW